MMLAAQSKPLGLVHSFFDASYRGTVRGTRHFYILQLSVSTRAIFAAALCAFAMHLLPCHNSPGVRTVRFDDQREWGIMVGASSTGRRRRTSKLVRIAAPQAMPTG